jgi:D-alanyl-D-alanine carboxypeptidase
MAYSKTIKILFLLLYILSSSAYPAATNHDSLNKKIQHIVDESRIKYKLPALSVSIKLPNNKQILNYTSGNYSLSENKPITSSTLFQIGSITKTFTASIVFKLIEEGKFNIHDKVGKWLPHYPKWKNITIGDLLRHTSGVYNYSSGSDFDTLLRENPGKYWSLNELAALSYQHANLFLPGKKYHYTNTDYVLLGMIIEKATHQSLQQVFDDYIKKYHLHNTFYSPSHYPSRIKNKIAHGYNRDGTFPFNKDVTFTSMSFTQSAGAMISSPSDLITWLSALFSGKIITPQSLSYMTAILSEENAEPINIDKIHPSDQSFNGQSFIEIGAGSGIGLIYFKEIGLTWVHSGGTPGYESFYAYNPRKKIFLALAYNVKPKQQLIFIHIANKIFAAL